MSSFEARHKVVRSGSTALNVFLMYLLQPWRWPIMLANGGIRVIRGTKPVENLTLDYDLLPEDQVFIDDAYGVTWMALRRRASDSFRDLVFCPQRNEKEKGGFLNNEVAALVADGTAVPIPLKTAGSLTELIPELVPLAKDPIRHLILVSHANPFGNIELPVKTVKFNREDPTAGYLNWETLKQSIADGTLRLDGTDRQPLVLPRPENGKGERVPCAIIIRGCSSGEHTILLKKIQEAFGPHVDTVVMPRHFDAADFITGGRAGANPALVEYFMHRFIVTSKTPLDRQGVIDAFKAAQLKDWLKNPVPDGDWDDLVPQNVRRSSFTKGLMLTIDGRSQPAEFKMVFEPKPLAAITQVMDDHPTEPTSAQIKEFVVKRWQGLPSFKDAEWPFWKRMGFGIKSEKEFIEFWTYAVDPDPDPDIKAQLRGTRKKWAVRAMRFSFEIRTPLIENGTLICKYQPNGEPGTASNNIDYNDDRIFGRYANIPAHFARTI